MRVIKQHLQLLLLGFLVALFGCSSQSDLSDYSKTFDNILTDQYIWSYGSGGIYWVSNEQVVLEAHVKNQQGALDKGLYQVDVRDGSYLKVVDVPEDTPITYTYCFDEKVLHVMTARGIFTLVNQPKSYQVEIRELGSKNRNNRYSPLRCDFVDIPQGKRVGYIPIRAEDGFIKNQGGDSKTDAVKVFLSDDLGNNLKELDGQRIDSRGVIGVRRFLPRMNAYFGSTSFNRGCTNLTWLHRDGWKLEQKELCLKDWEFGSKIVHSLKDALYVEHHTDRKKQPKTYVIYQDKELPLEMEQVRSSSVSPNGCKVAYGIGKYKDGRLGPRQKLKIFDHCEYQQKGLKL
tara:strand:+ start:2267 stop:3301 length:1035 start_codon:yes stop_codon:yes gene_type:complete